MNFECTEYFLNVVWKYKRPYLKMSWIEQVIESPEKQETQPDGRIKFWAYIPELERHLRVVMLADGKTIHNAFPDRGFKV